MTDSEVALKVLKYIHSKGCGIAIDDFGAGQSSFAYLKVLPVDIIKIDRMFISNIVTDPHDEAIVTAILDFAKRMNKKVIAEGVETSGTLDVLRKLRCGFDSVASLVTAGTVPASRPLALATSIPFAAARPAFVGLSEDA